MLQTIGVLTEPEVEELLGGLQEIYQQAVRGEFIIPHELEDCHTAIENFLTERLGEVGRKIHTGRSRNDQVLVAMRLFLRDAVIQHTGKVIHTADALLKRAVDAGQQMMPGHTHFQAAMPASVGMWFHAFAESFLELAEEGLKLFDSLDRNPLGVGSGFGIPLPLDRQLTSSLLGFTRVQRNPIDTQNSRGRYELRTLRWLNDICSVIEKFSWDVILYSSSEFGYFALHPAFTTGSSIMPQKHNPDVLELLRARAAKIRGAEAELALVIAKLPSHYHRDFQATKEPVFRALSGAEEALDIMSQVVDGIAIDEERLSKAMTPDLFVTYAVYREVRDGKTFRDAYRDVAARYREGKLEIAGLEEDFTLIEESLARDRAECAEDIRAVLEEWNQASSTIEELTKVLEP
jgi:argininosuccinate lyase